MTILGLLCAFVLGFLLGVAFCYAVLRPLVLLALAVTQAVAAEAEREATP
jgi:Sec-independent protein secretion pathway component TatC